MALDLIKLLLPKKSMSLVKSETSYWTTIKAVNSKEQEGVGGSRERAGGG